MKRKYTKERVIYTIKHWRDSAKRNLEVTPNNDFGEQSYYRGEIDMAELILIILEEDE